MTDSTQRPKRGQVTMREVAEAAGVGMGTVSRVFSNVGAVAPATRQRVEAAAKDLHYRPSALGRDLKRRTTNNIGLIVTDISNNFYGEFAQGVLASAKELGRHVILCASGEDPATEREYIDLLVEQRVDGIIAFPTGSNLDAWETARAIGINVLFADRTMADLDVPSILADNLGGARRLTEYLLALGHERIGYLGGPSQLTTGSQREAGYRLAHEQAGVPVIDELVVRTRFTRDTAYASAIRLLDSAVPPTALLASNNILGEAVLAAVRDRGLRVPEDLSLVMFDDVPWARLVDPAITVAAQPAWGMGQSAARMVLTLDDDTRSQVVPVDVVIRRSAAARFMDTPVIGS
ncbi:MULTISPECIES: LacI family DNA-binding transcriptional regulator [unclassified Curtobacterium]|uniref:LacI family DNA-binding transcriptional regulator n=1 Tax=unclassified Curtobacterium TaxID=257496 RepID=UPI000DA786D4|nr:MULTISPECIES: LacI family DNA-binding transcriptional regulator [unclassified Curtobacterium]PZE23255.1 LacI family transcriptional regulator [Curtobacterium sp. MCBD17_028]PZE72852.1 LacI family transcriptional regulator [Curtobacterium sp. MCBD17_019]PZF56054.1 LacI family transcriptional regulator [Curtobacterium sp. MCBD17_034]PZF59056.1 LacI family transcriptional regulator [Curtobacterium sp. MCBD17_013]PZM32922.1 LacI family transcriptional regulator [Curtobacterium sp. MCBD17_031]